MRWKRAVVVFAAVASIALAALGYNTLDWMTHICPPETWCFIWPDKLCMPFWYAYFFGGILPLASGSFLAGLIIGIVSSSKLRRGESKA